MKLHFCETFEGISGPGERVFTFEVEGKTFKDFDVWAKAGGGARLRRDRAGGNHRRPVGHQIHSASGKPQINGIEIIPVL